jgi:hypothetical protein
MSKFNKRAVDSLDIQVVIDVFIQKVTARCKAAVAAGVSNKINSLKAAKASLEQKLEKALAGRAGGLIGGLKKAFLVNDIKAELRIINRQIVDWINSVYRYYFA